MIMPKNTIPKSTGAFFRDTCNMITDKLRTKGKDVSQGNVKRMLIAKCGQPLLNGDGQNTYIKTNAPKAYMGSRKDLLVVPFKKVNDGCDFYALYRNPVEYTPKEMAAFISGIIGVAKELNIKLAIPSDITDFLNSESTSDETVTKLVFDIETTGMRKDYDEILQLSVIDQNGHILFNDYFRPIKHQSWPKAERINHISPDMVRRKIPIQERIPEIQGIFDKAKELIAYNASFDMKFLRHAGIVFPDVQVTDVMLDFANVYGEWNGYHHNYTYQKLSKAASFYGFEYNAHDSLEDVRATLFVYNAMKESKQE